MIPDLSAIFARYEALAAEADALFNHVRETHPHRATCARGCDDCCHAMFDLSLAEAMYLNKAFAESVPYGRERSDILSRAADLDRKTARVKRDMYKDSKAGKSPEEIMAQAARTRIACPLLDDQGSCLLYDRRPITCRLYGIPLNIAGKGHVCGKTAFSQGEAFPAVNMNAVHDRLEGLSREIAAAVGSRFKKLHEVYVPVSMALLTRYDEQYLGVDPAPRQGA